METMVLIAFSIATIITIRKLLEKFPGKYFSIQDFVTTNSRDINFLGFAIRFGTMFFYSFFVAIIYDGNIVKQIEFGVVVSLLLMWPFILHSVIYRNKKEEQAWGYIPKERKFIKKFLTVYFMYAFISIWFCIGAVPVYHLIRGGPSLIYTAFLSKYMTLDPFAQGLVTNLVSAVIWFVLGLFFGRILKKTVKQNESAISSD